MRYVFSTVGTSLLTNAVREKGLEINLYKYSNFKEDDFDDSNIGVKNTIDSLIEELKEDLSKITDERELRKKSAELNGILGFYRSIKEDKPQNDLHLLICTDTYQSKKVAEVLSDFLNRRGFSTEIIVVPSLTTGSNEGFELGTLELIEKMSFYVEGNEGEVIFNLVGGFKVVQGILTAIGMIWADRIIYIFETSNEVLFIPKLPVGINLEKIEKHFDILRKIDIGLRLSGEEKDIVKNKLNSFVSAEFEYLSTWGKALFEKVKKEKYSEKLISPLIDRIVYSDGFKKDFEKLENDKKAKVNETIDDFIRYLKTNIPLRRSRLRPVQGDIGFDYEIYATSYGEALRIFMRKEGNVYRLMEIKPHL